MARPAIITPEPVALPEHEVLARVFRTLGDATRLRLLEAVLAAGEATQRELVEAVGAPQPRVSEHLRCLTWCGLLAAERRGRVTAYRILDLRAEQFLALARGFLDDNAAAVGCCTVLDT